MSTGAAKSNLLTYDPDDPESVARLEHTLELRRKLKAAQEEMQRRKWLKDPVAWVQERLGEYVWSKQRLILESVRDNRRTSVPSCHNAGKSFIAARTACWWIESHPPGEAYVVTTAGTWKQVEVVLWKELRRAHAKGKLRGRTNRTEWVCPIVGGDGKAEEIVAFGHRPADTDPTAFHGIHAPYVLVIIDEASDIPKDLWDGADSLTSNEDSRILAIGNPLDPTAEFAETAKPGKGWNVIYISAFDTPNVQKCYSGIPVNIDGQEAPCAWEGSYKDGPICPQCNHPLPVKEPDADGNPTPVPDIARRSLVSYTWVREKELAWGRTNPLFVAKVLGQFPEFNADGLIPMHWIRAAQERELKPDYSKVHLGVDVGGGGDKNVIACRRGGHVRIVCEDREPDTMKTKDRIMGRINIEGASIAKVDYIGIGRGAVDQALREGAKVIGIEVGRAPNDDGYANLRAEAYWLLRLMFQDGTIDIDPYDEDLAAQLLDLKYETPSGRIQIESKDSMKRRGKVSPDRADAVMLAMFPHDAYLIDRHVTWGRDLPKQ